MTNSQEADEIIKTMRNHWAMFSYPTAKNLGRYKTSNRSEYMEQLYVYKLNSYVTWEI